ncbi:MAG: pyruvate dehydrogenase (acetyl-transferring) E1 component subunit alpha [Myxococcales bacterium]|nr:MAG: pyruvate dehydrogenase (acetyl-transferring) E1 component subunit alpha [Myxococcales bacterium]
MPTRKLATWSIDYMQVLDEHGKVDPKLEPKLSKDQLLVLYQSMVFARWADDRALKLQRQGRVGTIVLNSGQEAVSCAAALAMTEKDWFVPAFRELGGMLMRNVPLANFYIGFNGFEEGTASEGATRILPVCIPIASQLPHAVGLAYAMRYKGEKDSATVAFFGDGATSEGDFHEAMNFAGVWKVPVVFVCQNNHWAISVPVSKQTSSRTLAQKAIAYDIPGVQVDGNDALAVYRVVKEALDRARAGQGPTLIEAVTYRMLAHSTSDDPTRYRPDAEVEAWKKKDPIVRLKKYLLAKKILTAKLVERIDAEAKAKVEQAVADFEAKTDFKPDAAFDHVFGETHPNLEEQRAEFLAKIALEAKHG